MPLKQSSSPMAFKSNVKAEMKAGKPQKQSLAIAYSTKRANMQKKAKMAKGGMVSSCIECMSMQGACDLHRSGEYPDSQAKMQSSKEQSLNHDLPEMEREAHLANGGSVSLDPVKLESVSKGFKGALGIKKENEDEEDPAMMAEGGAVDDMHDLTPFERTRTCYGKEEKDVR